MAEQISCYFLLLKYLIKIQCWAQASWINSI